MVSKETKVGIFIGLSLIILYFGFYYLKGINFFSPANKYYALYDNIDQLSISSPVLINGYTVGRVSNITILQEKQHKIIVELDINSEIILGDSTIAILNSDFLGNKSILLSVSNTNPPIERGDTLYTEVARGILDMFSEQAEPVANNIQITLAKLDAVLDMLAVNAARLDSIFINLSYTPPLINKMLTNANQKVEDMSASIINTSEGLTKTLESARPTIKNLNTFSGSLNQLQLKQTVEKTQQALDRMTKIINKMTAKDNTLSKLIMEDSLYVNINTLLTNLDKLTKHFNSNPKHFLAPLGKTPKQIEKEKKKKKKKKKKK